MCVEKAEGQGSDWLSFVLPLYLFCVFARNVFYDFADSNRLLCRNERQFAG